MSSENVRDNMGRESHYAGGVNLPLPIVRAFRKRGFTRIAVELRDDGILLKPYSGETPPTKENERDTVELPF